MARTIATIIGLVGLVTAGYLLFVHQTAQPSVREALGLPKLDICLFGIAIAAVSILVIVTATKPRDHARGM